MTDLARCLDLAPYIDQALLDPTATPEDLKLACAQAEYHRFAALCVYPSAVTRAVELLRGKPVAVCAVIGFPCGASTPASKLYEAQEATEAGATELDVVINQGWLKAGLTNDVYQDLAQICEVTGQTVKAILEMSRLTETEKHLAVDICLDAGASYLKTSTGWFGGATVADVQFLSRLTQGRVGIKASGGIRSLAQAIALIEAGATRLGTSQGVTLLQQQQAME